MSLPWAMTMSWRLRQIRSYCARYPSVRAKSSGHLRTLLSVDLKSDWAVGPSGECEVIGSRLVQSDSNAVFFMGDELSVLLGSFGEDDALEDQSPSRAAVHR